MGAQVLGSPESFRETRHFGEEGLAMFRRCGDRIQLSIALGNFGFAAMAAGDYAAAGPVLEEAVAISEEVEDARVLPLPRSTAASCTFSWARIAWPPATSPERWRCAANPDSRCP